jgi:amidase
MSNQQPVSSPKIIPEYDDLDATALAELIKNKELSPAEVLEAAIERAELRNPSLNAIVTPLYERARKQAKDLPDGPFSGVPFLLKDLKAQLKGTPTSNGTKLEKGRIAEGNSLIVDRFLASGVQVMGKSNSPEFGIMGVTEPKIWGPCRNPWDLNRTPGGSSGGTSSAVAARIVPIAHAGDGGGSIRIPASATGTFGLKPTRGRVSMAPYVGEGWGGFVQEGVITRSVRDSALALDQIDQLTIGEPYAAPHKPHPWTSYLRAPDRKLKVAYITSTLFGQENHPDCVAAVESSVKLLDELGHHVEEARPSFPRDELVEAYFMIVASGTSVFVENTSAYAGVKPSVKNFETITWALAQIGWHTSAARLARARDTIHRASRQVAHFFSEYDLFVTSTHAAPPVMIGELGLKTADKLQLALIRNLPLQSLFDLMLKGMGNKALSKTPNTMLFNQTGQPGMSIPLHWNDDGLPIGTQVIAPFGGEGLLFQVATQLEEARPWAHRHPPFIKS